MVSSHSPAPSSSLSAPPSPKPAAAAATVSSRPPTRTKTPSTTSSPRVPKITATGPVIKLMSSAAASANASASPTLTATPPGGAEMNNKLANNMQRQQPASSTLTTFTGSPTTATAGAASSLAHIPSTPVRQAPMPPFGGPLLPMLSPLSPSSGTSPTLSPNPTAANGLYTFSQLAWPGSGPLSGGAASAANTGTASGGGDRDRDSQHPQHSHQHPPFGTTFGLGLGFRDVPVNTGAPPPLRWKEDGRMQGDVGGMASSGPGASAASSSPTIGMNGDDGEYHTPQPHHADPGPPPAHHTTGSGVYYQFDYDYAARYGRRIPTYARDEQRLYPGVGMGLPPPGSGSGGAGANSVNLAALTNKTNGTSSPTPSSGQESPEPPQSQDPPFVNGYVPPRLRRHPPRPSTTGPVTQPGQQRLGQGATGGSSDGPTASPSGVSSGGMVPSSQGSNPSLGHHSQHPSHQQQHPHTHYIQHHLHPLPMGSSGSGSGGNVAHPHSHPHPHAHWQPSSSPMYTSPMDMNGNGYREDPWATPPNTTAPPMGISPGVVAPASASAFLPSSSGSGPRSSNTQSSSAATANHAEFQQGGQNISRDHERVRSPTKRDPNATVVRRFTCPECNEAFTRRNDLARHRRKHTGEKPFACPVCGHAFARKDKLLMHIQRSEPCRSRAPPRPSRGGRRERIDN